MNPGMLTVAKKKEIGLRFQDFREAIGKSREELARELGITPNDFAKIEQGAIMPGISILKYLRTRFGLNIDWLMDKKEEMFSRDYGTFVIIFDNVKYTRRHIKYFKRVLEYPSIKTLLLERFMELRLIFKKELKEFLAQKAEAESKQAVP